MPSRSLHARFRTAIVLIATVLTTVMALVVHGSARTHYLAAGEASARAMAVALEQTAAVGAYAGDAVLLAEIASGLARHPSVAHVAIRDADGRELAAASAGAPPAPGLPGPAASAVAARATPASFASALASPFDAGEPVGSLHVWLDTEQLSTHAQRQALTLVGAIVVLLATVLAAFTALARRMLARPMHRLAEALRRIEPGTAHRVPIDPRHADDEVGTVATAANHLLDLQQSAMARERAMREEIAAMEARYRGIFDSSSAGLFVLSPQGRVLQVNPALERLLDGPSASRVGWRQDAFAASAFREPSRLVELVHAARASSRPEDGDLELADAGIGPRWVHCMVSLVRDAAGVEQWIEGVLYDITQRRLQEVAARHRAEHDALTGLKSRSFIESALDHRLRAARSSDSAVTLMFIDLDGFKAVNDRWGHAAGDAVLTEAARRLRGLFMRSSDIVGRLGGDELVVVMEGLDALHPAVRHKATQLIESFQAPFPLPSGETARIGASVGVASYPMHATTPETLIHAADAAMYAVKQSGKGGFVVARTEAGRSPGPLPRPPSPERRSAPPDVTRDPLTGLPDRRQLIARLVSARDAVAAGGPLAAVICLDLQQFTAINLAYGSAVGDAVLREVAQRLVRSLRTGDTVARTGSDEFVMIAATAAADRREATADAATIARKLLASLAEPIPVGDGALTLHARSGVSLIDGAEADPDEVLKESQLALRRSKASAGLGPVVFERDMMAGFRRRLEVETALKAALGLGQLQLQVQPQVDLAHGVRGGEVLLRWQHPTWGWVPPDQFIPVAESSGDIVDLGGWVLREACAVLARLHRAGVDQTLSVNISPAQFNHPGFAAQVHDALAASGAPPTGLILEITENLLVTDVARVAARLDELVSLGVRFSIDDFGTGFSSLGYLQRLPLHEIKVDRAFTASLGRDAAADGIVRSIIAMGTHLGLAVVAEGVETVEQSRFLQAAGCPLQQGWLHGRPMDVDRFLEHVGAGAVADPGGDVAPAPHGPSADRAVGRAGTAHSPARPTRLPP